MSDFDDVFARDNVGRINGFVSPATERAGHLPTSQTVALSFQLLDPQTRFPTDEEMWLQMEPVSAMRFVVLLLDIAKEKGWEIPQSTFQDVPGNPKGLN